MHFRGEYRFLSNFHPVRVQLDGVWYPSVENAYQASKTKDAALRKPFTRMTAGQAKAAGKKLKAYPEWEKHKTAVMLNLVSQKFSDKILRTFLHGVAGEIVEDNYWHDNFWGRCECSQCRSKASLNYLGRILMIVRDHPETEAQHEQLTQHSEAGTAGRAGSQDQRSSDAGNADGTGGTA